MASSCAYISSAFARVNGFVSRCHQTSKFAIVYVTINYTQSQQIYYIVLLLYNLRPSTTFCTTRPSRGLSRPPGVSLLWQLQTPNFQGRWGPRRSYSPVSFITLGQYFGASWGQQMSKLSKITVFLAQIA